jgi:4-amino-4-deoxy-L-arabinose transferase-like glycosyltransferase
MLAAPMQRRLLLLLPYLLYLGATVPFSGKAFDIDDTIFVKAARQVERDPLRPLEVWHVWQGIEVNEANGPNPPLHAYLLAAARLFFGESEWALHLTLLPWGLLTLWATGVLARRFGVSPLWAQILVAVAPPLIGMSTTVMPDLLLSGLFTAGMALGLRAADEGKLGDAVLAGACVGAAAITRYSGLGALLLLWVYPILTRRPFSRIVPAIATALVPLLAWSLISWIENGVPHPANLFRPDDAELPRHVLEQTVVMIGLVGGAGMTAPILAVAFLIEAKGRWILVGLSAGAIVSFAIADQHCGSIQCSRLIFLYPIFFFSPGLMLLGWSAGRLVRLLRFWPARDPGVAEDAFLSCWLWGVALSPVLYSHVAAKYLLPAVPALVLLALRRFREPPRFLLPAAVGLGLVASVLLAVGDHERAEVARQTAAQVVEPLLREGHTVWSRAEWGFQYYLERIGARALPRGAEPAPGDLVLTTKNTPQGPPPAEIAPRIRARSRLSFSTSFPVVTMSPAHCAGFYSHTAGWLPFALAIPPVEIEEVTLHEVVRLEPAR